MTGAELARERLGGLPANVEGVHSLQLRHDTLDGFEMAAALQAASENCERARIGIYQVFYRERRSGSGSAPGDPLGIHEGDRNAKRIFR